MLKIGLTGNIGCGKSSISKELAKNNIKIIDADLISREIYEYEELLEEVSLHFPEAVKDSTVDRKRLGQIVFSNSEKMNILNCITHRKIEELILERLEICSCEKITAVVDATLLYEAGLNCVVDKVVVVFCNEETQIERVMKRDSISRDEALKRINSQMSQQKKVEMADFVIDNSGTPEDLKKSIDNLITQIEEWKKEYGGM